MGNRVRGWGERSWSYLLPAYLWCAILYLTEVGKGRVRIRLACVWSQNLKSDWRINWKQSKVIWTCWYKTVIGFPIPSKTRPLVPSTWSWPWSTCITMPDVTLRLIHAMTLEVRHAAVVRCRPVLPVLLCSCLPLPDEDDLCVLSAEWSSPEGSVRAAKPKGTC